MLITIYYLLMRLPPPTTYSKSAINKAGRLLVDESINIAAKPGARQIVNSWRASHAYPINTFQATLRKRVAGLPGATVAQRLKRFPTILDKLLRQPNMSLARMQDIGGVRVILDTIADVREVEMKYKLPSKIMHELVNEHDYITNPKADGYRGIHLVYRYKSIDQPGYNGLHVEIQIRTKLQHFWATAVETIGTFTNTELKSGKGSGPWLDFFVKASAAFAIFEPGTQTDLAIRKEVLESVSNALDRVGGLSVLQGFQVTTEALKRHLSTTADGSNYHILTLRPSVQTLNIHSYSDGGIATQAYSEFESETRDSTSLVVLVRAQTRQELERAYPNFFLDIKEFQSLMTRIIREVESY